MWFGNKKEMQTLREHNQYLSDQCQEKDLHIAELQTKLTAEVKSFAVTRSQDSEALRTAVSENKALVEQRDQLQAKVDELQLKLDALQTKHDNLINQTANSDKNEVRIIIDDDLTGIVPIIRYNESAYDMLVQKRYISDGRDNSIQLGLLVVAHEGLQQIVDAFHDVIVNPEE